MHTWKQHSNIELLHFITMAQLQHEDCYTCTCRCLNTTIHLVCVPTIEQAQHSRLASQLLRIAKLQQLNLSAAEPVANTIKMVTPCMLIV